MANFDNGIASYIVAEAVVKTFFPVDFKGNADISCNQCEFYRRQSKICGLNGKICQYPERYVGASCPLHIKEE